MDDAVRVNTKNYDYYYLCAELRRKRMIPVYTRIRAKSLEEFGELVRHSGEEYIYVVEGSIIAHTEFYDPVELRVGQSIYIDSTMGHAYIAAKGCKEAVVLAVCSSADDSLLESLYSLHGDVEPQHRRRPRRRRRGKVDAHPSADARSTPHDVDGLVCFGAILWLATAAKRRCAYGCRRLHARVRIVASCSAGAHQA